MQTNGPSAENWHEVKAHTVADVSILGERVAALMSQAGFPDKDLFAVRLALEEAIVNGIRHGNGNDPAKAVHVRYQVAPHQVLAEIEDQGTGFDPANVPDPLAPENLERPSGRGIFLIRHYMTWVTYNERGNSLTLCKERSAT